MSKKKIKAAYRGKKRGEKKEGKKGLSKKY
jgi:hypothetical protein